MQEFLSFHRWDHARMRDLLQLQIAAEPIPANADPAGLGPIGLVDDTAHIKKGDKSPGVQRQWCGRLGKTENCLVTVHLGVVHGDFHTLLDADLYLPESWSQDRPRCRAAAIPDELVYRPEWQISLDQVRRTLGHGLRLDWLTFDEGYGSKPEYLFALDDLGQNYVGEVPCNFRAWATRPQYRSGQKAFASHEVRHLCRYSPAFTHQNWTWVDITRQTREPQRWRVRAALVHLARHQQPTDRRYWLLQAVQVDSQEEKYFVANAPASTPLETLLRVAFQRAAVEHLFAVAKGEVGLTHFEGQSYMALMRHLILCLVVLGFVAGQAARLNRQTVTVETGHVPEESEGEGEKKSAVDGTDRRALESPVPPVAGRPAPSPASTFQDAANLAYPALYRPSQRRRRSVQNLPSSETRIALSY